MDAPSRHDALQPVAPLAGIDSPRVLICRLSAVGDCVLTLPMLCALREQFPRSFLAWVAEAPAASLLASHARLDRLLILSKGWLRSPASIVRLRRDLRALRFDVAIDAQSLTKSAMAAWLSAAPIRIGFACPQGRELAPRLNTHLVQRGSAHVVDAHMKLLEPLGIHDATIRFELPREAHGEASADRFLESSHLGCGFAVVNPGAGWDSKLWPADRFGRVVRGLGERFQLPTVVAWSGRRELAWAEQIVAGSGGHAVLAPPTDLDELTALLRRARFFLGSDTGPMHMAAAVGTRCVGLFGPTRPSDCGPYGDGHVTVQACHPGHAGSRQRRRATNAAMCAIDVDTVLEACASILHREKRS